MAKTRISEYSVTNSSNTDINSINIDEGCAPSGINNAIREVMVHLKNWQTNASGDGATFASLVVQGTGSFTGAVTMSAGATLSGTNTLSGSNIISGNINSSGTTNTFSGGNILSGTNTISGSAIISGNINSSGTTNTFSGGNILSGTNTLSGSTVMAASLGTSASPSIYFTSDTNTGIFSPTADTVGVATGGSERVRVDSSGNVGIGTTSPGNKLHVENNSTTVPCGFRLVGGSANTSTTGLDGGAFIALRNLSTTSNTYNLIFSEDAGGNATSGIVFQNNSDANNEGTLAFLTRPSGGSITERARITSGGVVCINETAQINNGRLCITDNLSNFNPIVLKNSTAQAAGQQFVIFINSAGNAAGRIEHTGTTTVAYTTSSDYRLKENVARMTNGLEKVMQLNPVTYTWKEDKKEGQGFIAHELQAVIPDCVTGEKDAIETYTDENGNEQTRPKYQGIDTSFLVATLTAAIQELNAKVETLEAQNAAFEARLAALENK